MKCGKAKILISAQMDEEISVKDSLALEEHLHSCPECADFKVEMASMSRTLALWADEEPSPYLAQRFAYKLQEMDEPSAPKRSFVSGWTFRTVAKIAAVVALVGLFVLSEKGPVNVVVDNGTSVTETATAPVDNTSDTVTVDPIETQPAAEVQPPVTEQQPKPAAPRRPHRRPAPSVEPSKPIEMAAANISETENSVMAEIDNAANTEVSTDVTVAMNLRESASNINDTLEIVRGNLQLAVDNLSSRSSQPDGK